MLSQILEWKKEWMEHNRPAEVTILRMQTPMARGTENTRMP